MDRTRHLAASGYLVALTLILFPVTDSAIALLPTQFSSVAWRFGAVGLFSRTCMTVLLGVVVAFAIALLMEHSRVQRWLSILSGLGVLALLATLGIFTLDAVQMRSQVRPEAITAFDVASAVAVAKYLFAVVAMTTITIGSWKASARAKSKQKAHGTRERSAIVIETRAAGEPVGQAR